MTPGVNFAYEPGPLLSIALDLTNRLEKGQYVPIATEAHGMYKTALGTFCLAVACLGRLYEYSADKIHVDPLGFTYSSYIILSKGVVVEGLAQITYFPRETVREIWQLGRRSIQTLSG